MCWTRMGNRTMHAAVLDMGPGSVDGWLLQLAANELGIEAATGVLDRTKRALHVDGALVPLTRREFDVMAYLAAREGDPVARDSLIQDVWGLRFDPGSNVVDAVVASLRRKLGTLSGAIETVRGFGYLYRAAALASVARAAALTPPEAERRHHSQPSPCASRPPATTASGRVSHEHPAAPVAWRR